MKPGDKIKAFVQIGLMKEPRWIRGTLVEQGIAEVNGNRLTLEPGKIMLWEQLEWKDGVCPAVDNFAEENWEDLKEYVAKGMKEFFPEENYRFDDKEKIVYACDDNITIGADIQEIKSIARFFEVPTWTVTEYRTAYYGHLQPPDVDEISLGESRSSLGAAKILVDAIWKEKSGAFWEMEGERVEA